LTDADELRQELARGIVFDIAFEYIFGGEYVYVLLTSLFRR
jgi:hypothetical protein